MSYKVSAGFFGLAALVVSGVLYLSNTMPPVAQEKLQEDEPIVYLYAENLHADWMLDYSVWYWNESAGCTVFTIIDELKPYAILIKENPTIEYWGLYDPLGRTILLNPTIWPRHPAVMIHELGHVVGAEHSDSTSSLMHHPYAGGDRLKHDDVKHLCLTSPTDSATLDGMVPPRFAWEGRAIKGLE